MAYSNIPAEAYKDSFSFNGVSYDPVKFVERLDMAILVHRDEPKSHRSVSFELPAKHYETQFEFDGHTYKHITEHSEWTTSDILTCDDVPNARAWQRVINQVTEAHPDLFPNRFRPDFGMDFTEYGGGEGPTWDVEENLDSLSDALRQFAALHGYTEGTPVDDERLVGEFAKAAIPTMNEFICGVLNEKYPGEAAVNSKGYLCVSPNLMSTRNEEYSGARRLFHRSVPEAMEKYAEKVGEEYEKAVENGDIVPVDEPER